MAHCAARIGRAHLPDTMRLWQGDSVGHWEGDTLVVDTTNFNGKTWLNEGGEIVSYAEHVVERFTPAGPDTVNYEATVTDPVVYTRPWTISFPMRREKVRTDRGGVSRGRSRPPAPESSQGRGRRGQEEIGSLCGADPLVPGRRPRRPLPGADHFANWKTSTVLRPLVSAKTWRLTRRKPEFSANCT